VTSFTKTPRAPIAGESFTVSVTVARVGRAGRFNGTVYCSKLPGVQARWFGSVGLGRAACRWDIPRAAVGKTVIGSIGVSEGGARVTRRFSAKVVPPTAVISIEGGINVAPPRPVSGQKFYYRMGISVRRGSTAPRRITQGSVSCRATVNGRALHVFEQQVVRKSGIRCGWDVLPGMAGKKLVGLIIIRSEGATFRHAFTRRIG
jgi:hypothetical protein